MSYAKKLKSFALGTSALCMMAGIAQADIIHADDVIINGGSLCVGFDCVNGESFGFDTIRLKENNLRIHFQDTSTSASFPSTDWRLVANDTTNGGANRFSIEDSTAGRTPFTVEGGAPNNSLYVDDGGRVGIGTNAPVVEAHIKNGDSPTLRLEQDGSSGFQSQTWDIAGNEAGFFVRDVTNGSLLSFRILPNAPAQALVIEGTTGDVGVGAGTNPTAALHVRRTNGTAQVLVEDTSASNGQDMVHLKNNGSLEMLFENTATSTVDVFKLVHTGSEFRILNQDTAGTTELALDANGNLSLLGNLTVNTGGTPSSFPDYVFDPDYKLMPIYEVEQFIEINGHLPKIPSAEQVAQEGINVSQLQISLLEKVEELTLYTLAQQKLIDELRDELDRRAD